jgi:translation elongation factor EF-G
LERFSIEADFEPPEVLYKETIASPVTGCGHFEPLRHYAEVHLLLEPAERGSGITFESTCHVDMLSLNYQHLVRTHVFEKEHKGILTGSPLTDVKITLTKGRSHIKHTEGGDFREAVCRAIRQGLEHAENVLLEPYYEIEIYTETSYMGRILSDIQRLNGTIKPPEQTGASLHISAYGPVSCFMDYPAELISFTRGSAAISMKNCGYDVCHNPEEVIERKDYHKDADLENVSCSVFCHKGESFLVPWEKAEEYMHC